MIVGLQKVKKCGSSFAQSKLKYGELSFFRQHAASIYGFVRPVTFVCVSKTFLGHF